MSPELRLTSRDGDRLVPASICETAMLATLAASQEICRTDSGTRTIRKSSILWTLQMRGPFEKGVKSMQPRLTPPPARYNFRDAILRSARILSLCLMATCPHLALVAAGPSAPEVPVVPPAPEPQVPILTYAEVLAQFNNHPDTVPLLQALAQARQEMAAVGTGWLVAGEQPPPEAYAAVLAVNNAKGALRAALATFIGASGLIQHMTFLTIIENVTNQEWD